MTDDRIDALLRRLDVPSEPDPAFGRATFAVLQPRVRTAQIRDASRIGRLRRDLGLTLARGYGASVPRPLGVVGVVVLLVLAALVALVVGSAVQRSMSVPNGPLVVSLGGKLVTVDAADGSTRPMIPTVDGATGVSRSPDGRLVSFWTKTDGRWRLFVVGVNGADRREIAPNLALTPNAAIDTWSADSRFLATEATLGGDARIIVVDVESGTARPLTPQGVIGHDPLWSPDGAWLAFTEERPTGRALAMIRTDGSEVRTLSGGLDHVSGPDTWSPDGAWIYFDNGDGRIFRSNTRDPSTQLLIGDRLAYAPASSPDGAQIAFIHLRPGGAGWDLYIAKSDGTGAHRLLEHATNNGWSRDGRYVLTEWTPTDQPGGLAVVRPDGSDFRVVLPFTPDCRAASTQTCTSGVGWGEPRP